MPAHFNFLCRHNGWSPCRSLSLYNVVSGAVVGVGLSVSGQHVCHCLSDSGRALLKLTHYPPRFMPQGQPLVHYLRATDRSRRSTYRSASGEPVGPGPVDTHVDYATIRVLLSLSLYTSEEGACIPPNRSAHRKV